MQSSALRGGRRRAQSGATLIEAAVVATVCAVLAAAAASSMAALADRQRVRSLAAQLEADIQYARSEALVQPNSVRLSFPPAAGGTCYIVHTGPANACLCTPTGAPQCGGGVIPLRVHHAPMAVGVRLASNSRSMLFDARRHTVSPTGSVTITGRYGRSMRQVVNILGRVRSCTPDGMPGLPRC